MKHCGKQQYNGKPTTGQMIVIIFAVYGFLRLLLDLTACSASHAVYAGLGNQLKYGSEDWKRPGTEYGKIGYEADWLIHERDNVHLIFDVHHKSDPGETDRGEENVEIKLKKVFE